MCHFIYRHLDEVPRCYTWHKNTLYNQHAALSVGLLTNDLSNRDEPDKTRMEKEMKKNYLFIYRHLYDIQHCYTWHNDTSQNKHTLLSVGLLTNAFSNRDKPS
jgi:hypothetical protein